MISLAVRKLTPNTIIKLTHFFYSKIIPYLSKSSNRGRPKIYPDHQIFSMLLIKEMFSLSQRNHHSVQRLLQKSSIPQRFPLQGRKLKHVIQILIKFIHNIDSIIVDGTGIRFKKKTNLNWMRRTQVRKVKGHIRCEVVMRRGDTN